MSAVSALLYGLVQGITEFLPVSSSAHLALFHAWFGEGGQNLAIDVLLHLSTLAAVLLVYGRDLFPLIPALLRLPKRLFRVRYAEWDGKERLAALLVLGTLPLALLLPLRDLVARVGQSPRAVGALLLCNAAQLFVCDRIGEGTQTLEALPPPRALGIGLSQAMAGFPGLSRSGTTVTWGVLLGLRRDEAVKLSFLLSVPAVVGANLAELPVLCTPGAAGMSAAALLCGMGAALVSGLCAVWCLKWMAEKSKMKWLGVWCAALGLAAVIAG